MRVFKLWQKGDVEKIKQRGVYLKHDLPLAVWLL
jgi:hypothetical protein